MIWSFVAACTMGPIGSKCMAYFAPRRRRPAYIQTILTVDYSHLSLLTPTAGLFNPTKREIPVTRPISLPKTVRKRYSILRPDEM